MPPRTIALDDPFGLEALHHAWTRVRANGGACGPDEVCIDVFARDAETRLERLADDLARGRYRPGALRRAAIPKKDGGKRLLAIPNVRDRVAQSAVATFLTHRLDARMAPTSFAYRPARSVDMALLALRRAWRSGRRWTLDADITRFFDRTPHGLLRVDLNDWIGEAPALHRVLRLWIAGFGRFGRGLAQGSPVSPILANIFLDPLDRAFAGQGDIIRYADDFVIAVRGEEEALTARRLAARVLRARGLALNPAKTAIRPPGEPFVFLGREVSSS